MLFRRRKDKEPDKKSRTGKEGRQQESPPSSASSSPVLEISCKTEITHTLDRILGVAESAGKLLKAAQREGDIDEFVFTIDDVINGLARAKGTFTTSMDLLRKLSVFLSQLEVYERNLMHHGKKLADALSSARRRPALAQLSARIHSELLVVLAATNPAEGAANAADIVVDIARKRSISHLLSDEARRFWRVHFSDIDLDVVPWDTFIAAFQKSTSCRLDLSEDRLLKHVLDNDNINAVTCKELNSFLKAFGPIDKSLSNVKELFKQKWFHGFLSVEEVLRCLADQQPGTFLVRFSRSKAGAFALEYVESKGKVRTVLIKNNMPLGVSIAEVTGVELTFSSIYQLIQHYSDTLKYVFHSDLLHKNWFFGDLSTEEAEENLAGRPVGTFMIRFSDTGRFQYVASYIPETRGATSVVQHAEIVKVPSGFAFASPLEADSGSTATIYPSLPKLIAASRSILKYNFDPENVPRLRILPYSDMQHAQEINEWRGPLMSDGSGTKISSAGDWLAARTVASYPKGSLGWNVVCDQWAIRKCGQRIVFALADGCGWGAKPREAAIRASQEVVAQLSDPFVQTQLNDTLDCKHFLLRAFSLAHEAILKEKEDVWAAGTTTLVAGMLLPLPNSADTVLVAASVGDCKVFVCNLHKSFCSDITHGNRRNLRDATDPGGRLGPILEPGGHPDLRNLASYFWPLAPDDILVTCTDGVHDNLDPEALALSPQEAITLFSSNHPLRSLQLPSGADWKASWDLLASPHAGELSGAKLVEKIKGAYMTTRLCQLVGQNMPTPSAASSSPPPHVTIACSSIVDSLINHALNTTAPSRSFMEANPDKSEPRDRVKFPGKMDHVSAIAIRLPIPDSASTPQPPVSSSPPVVEAFPQALRAEAEQFHQRPAEDDDMEAQTN